MAGEQTSLMEGEANGFLDICLNVPLRTLHSDTCFIPSAGGAQASHKKPDHLWPQISNATYLTLRETPWGTPMLTAAPRTLCLEILLSAPYSTTVPKKPALQERMAVSEQGPQPPCLGTVIQNGTGSTTAFCLALPATHGLRTEQSQDPNGPFHPLDPESCEAWDCTIVTPAAPCGRCLRNVTQTDEHGQASSTNRLHH